MYVYCSIYLIILIMFIMVFNVFQAVDRYSFGSFY